MNETMLLAADAQAPIADAAIVPAEGALADAVVAPVETETRTCPVCRARLFADMGTCFNCMYRFGSNQALEEKAAARARMQAEEEPAAPPIKEQEPTPPYDQGRADQGTDGYVGGHGHAEPEQPATVQPEPAVSAELADDERLLRELLVELHGFLGKFLLDRGIDAKQL